MHAEAGEGGIAATRTDPTVGRDAEARAPGSWTVADPGPLGLAAFALTTFVLSMFNSGLVSDKGEPIVFGLAFAYGGLAQLLAGMWEFRTGNTFGATAFTSYGAFWLSFFVFVTFFADKIPTADAGHAVGLYLIAWGIFTAYMFVASLRDDHRDRRGLPAADADVLPARHRRRGRPREHHQAGRLVRPRHRGGGVVCLLRSGDQLDVRADGASGEAAHAVTTLSTR